MIRIYTDGSCGGNPGLGGWAAVINEDGATRTVAGHEEDTTNNRMEILAAIKGLEATHERSEVTIVSDSQYLVNTMVKGWKRNANQDLWARLDTVAERRRVRWEWVRGHVGHPGNEQANALATDQIRLRPAENGEHLAHLDTEGRARMVDVGWKEATSRMAVAKGSVRMKPETLRIIQERQVEKGDVLGAARIAGIMGAKRTWELIPMCHPIPLDQVSVVLEPDESTSAIHITATARTIAKTGVEMEALTAVAVAALTVYDMTKSVDRGMRIEGVRLVSKSGGRSGNIRLES